MSFLFKLSVFVGLLAAALVMVEKHCPQMSMGDLPESMLSPELKEWKSGGKMVNVHGHEMFVREEGEKSIQRSLVSICDFKLYIFF